jgi:hypothetical protein
MKTAPQVRLCTFTLVAASAVLPLDAAGVWGRLANPGFDGARIKATLFFPGQARDGTSPYGCSIPDQRGFHTVHPLDGRHLVWSASAANRDFALQQMAQAGINVVEMSFWGEDFLPCSTAWAAFAPMQDAPPAQDELFVAATGQSRLIVPFIESRGDWAMRYEFPTWTDGQVAPGVVSQICNLVQRYLQNASHPEWAGRWAKVYNREGHPRYAVALIHASSERLSGGEHQAFAAGFDALADAVEAATGVQVGFLLDALPPGTFAPGAFRPSAEQTGPFLANTRSVLAINCFIPEIWVGSSDSAVLLAWKRDFLQRWQQTGLPVFVDVSPGYDAHLIFGSQAAPPYGYTAEWREGLTQLVADLAADGITYNSWNGYTEGMAGMPTVEQGAVWHEWLAGLHWVCDYSLAWWAVVGGGGRSTGGTYSLAGTAGQPQAGPMSGGDFKLTGGSWSFIAAIQTPGAPRLTITRSDGAVIVSWPSTPEGWVLESANVLPYVSAPWTPIPPPYQTNGANLQFAETAPRGHKFYRLHRPAQGDLRP